MVLSTAHPAKFSEAVTRALQSSSHFNFERDVLPKEFHGLLDKEKRVIDVRITDNPKVTDNLFADSIPETILSGSSQSTATPYPA